MWLFGGWAPSAWANDGTTVIVFSRHTFRGVSREAKPLEITLGSTKVALPLLGYTRDATIHGLELARRYGGPAIQMGAESAVAALGNPLANQRKFDGRWDEVRVDMSVGRDFFTGLYFREALQPFQAEPIALTGYPTERSHQADAVLGCDLVRQCLPLEAMKKLKQGSVGAARLQSVGQELVTTVLEALDLPDTTLPPLYDAEGKRSAVYDDLHTLASTIEMVSEEGPPLQTLFPLANKDRIARFDPEVGELASRYLAVAFTVSLPQKAAYAAAVVPLQYVRAQEGRRVILATHDDVLSVLVRSLGLVAEDGSAEALSMLPMESLVLAFDAHAASVVRVRMKRARDGSLPGPFTYKLMWHGTRTQWESKISYALKEAAAWPVGVTERAKLHWLEAPELHVIYRTTN